MTEHLPECWAKDESDPPAWSICDELRFCEQRVRESEACLAVCADRHYVRGLYAAREAVAALLAYDSPYGPLIRSDAALSAIDALREK